MIPRGGEERMASIGSLTGTEHSSTLAFGAGTNLPRAWEETMRATSFICGCSANSSAEIFLRLSACTLILSALPCAGQTFYVATGGDDASGDGSLASPWASIARGLAHLHDNNLDGATLLVRPGAYSARQSLVGTFTSGVTVRSEVPYQARLHSNNRPVIVYPNSRGASGITLEGFDIAHTGPGAAPLAMHLDGGGGNSGIGNITIRNNVFHDSYDNDLLKINNGAANIVVEGNMFYNQTGSDEHIDVNSVEDVIVRDNVFFNDFAGSGRTNGNNTGSYVVIKDSNNDEDIFVGNDRISVQRNVFLNWEGSTGSNFVLIGEDAKPYIEARNVLIENNLMLGNSPNVMRAAVGVKSGENVTFRNNTISGDLPALAYAMRVNVENPQVTNNEINFYNNIWSDPTGTMGASFGGANDFSDTPPGETTNWELLNNQYFNGGAGIPSSGSELINYTDDLNRIVANPGLPVQNNVVIPRWDPASGKFADGSLTVREAFVNLVMQFSVPAASSQGIDNALPQHTPPDDILGHPRAASPDVGALELIQSVSADVDGDQDVDGHDLLQIQQTTIELTPAWQQHYGNAAVLPATLPIPEPTTAWLLTASGLATQISNFRQLRYRRKVDLRFRNVIKVVRKDIERHSRHNLGNLSVAVTSRP